MILFSKKGFGLIFTQKWVYDQKKLKILKISKRFLKLVDPVLVEDCEDLHDVRGVHSANKAE